ncbi:MAG: efflux RND transporter permease subunit [Colwellia sp.]|uniref:efflux RND transporter permease subunit n=1 Tax=Colwellia sp. TaxID=56799 RepID=UPI001D794DC7|nr:efflux RND transporter permease subunit [Colwellia sp.]NQY48119.1 efflux RND transporter permease subunit [Colwellia sp.]
MNLTELAIENKVVTYFTIVLLSLAGTFAFFSLGQLEDPEFTVKNALVLTMYNGATAQEVEQEVTDRIENALQEMPELSSLHSRSTPGFSLIKVEIKEEYWADRLPQVWDKLRRKVGDVQRELPYGVSETQVVDDFGNVYGLMLGITGDGFTYAEIDDYVRMLQKKISLLKGVARVDLWGNQQEAVFIDISASKVANLGISNATLANLLTSQNMVVDAGHIESGNNRLRVNPSGDIKTPQEIADIVVYGQSSNNMGEFIRIGDIATVNEGYIEPTDALMRLNGKEAIVLSVSPLNGINVVEVGERVAAKLAQITKILPVGIEINQIHWQSDVVNESVNAFLINFVEAVLIVLVILTLAMGWRIGIVIGTALILTILATFMLMAVFGIDLHRMSLGALIIALGMMVDNAIVVAEGYVVKIQNGLSKKDAAVQSAKAPSMALLGATIIAVMAFYPIFASIESAGEYCRTLFIVVAISLMVSWLVSLTITPLQCMFMLKVEAKQNDKESKLLSLFRLSLEGALKHRVLTIIGVVTLLVISLGTFSNVKQIFFPSSAMTKITIDYWAQEGMRIQATSEGLKKIEEKLLSDERVNTVSTFIGKGSPRFYLPVDPENPNPAYGQIIVNMQSFDDIDTMVNELEVWLAKNVTEAMTRVRKYSVGPAITWTFEARFIGPPDADPAVLRTLAVQGMDILHRNPLAKEVSTDWRQQVLEIVPEYNQVKGRQSAILPVDLATTTKRLFDGYTIGAYRKGDKLLPIIVREKDESRTISSLESLQITPSGSSSPIPLGQVIDKISTQWVNPIIWRYNRHRAITVQASPVGVTIAKLRASVVEEFEQIALPAGYELVWFGEHKNTIDSQDSLIPGVLPALAIILFILVALFNEIRPMIIIMLIIPFVMIGVSFGLQVSGAAFGFVTLLGVMSLSGMMIKNAIVLVDQINIEKLAGKSVYQAIVDATISRIRPVFLAAATTVLGVAPLVPDVFWQGLAIAIMAGLTFGTLLTMILLPVLYSIFYRATPSK